MINTTCYKIDDLKENCREQIAVANLCVDEFPFLQLVEATPCLWQHLAKTAKPILLYGMGDGAGKIIAYLQLFGQEIAGVFASDDFVRGQSFAGKKVLTYEQAVAEFGQFIVLVAFGTQKPEVIANILRIAQLQEVYAPNVPLFGEGLFDCDFVVKHCGEFQSAYDALADDVSRQVFAAICNYSLSGKIDYLMAATTEKAAAYQILNLGSQEVYLDLGAYNGDTILEFLTVTGGKYEEIIGVEPDFKNCRKLVANLAEYPDVRCLNQGIWQAEGKMFFDAKSGRNSSLQNKLENKPKTGQEIAVTTLDSIQEKYLGDKPVTYIKMDVEGAEKQALLGGSKLLAEVKPKLLVSGYHRNEDLFLLPNLLKKLNPAYQIYLRHHLYIPGWENNFYAI